MKKLLIAACMLFAFTGIATAQAAKKTTMTAVKSEAPQAKVVKMESAAIVKKDGTPDKRFKANKEAPAAPAGPVKKDGTPDKRYKANKKN
jgi:hypothetical protein